jgi:FKBP-type peptidyl-prolyl cis-trans isomerase
MHLIIDHRLRLGIIASMLLLITSCLQPPDKGPEPGSNMGAFKPYVIADSTKIITFPDGLKLYHVQQGPGDFPTDGISVKMNYYGVLQDGKIFDESYSRKEPLTFTVGGGKVIAGIDEAIRKIRYGGKAILVIPPSLGYGEATPTKDLPPNIPPNATLTFHIELLGTF